MIKIYREFATRAEAEAFRDALYLDYHPCGYGTTIDIYTTPARDKWIASGHRFNSCD